MIINNGLTLEALGTRSIPRNPLLFGMMQRMDLVEKVGSGLKRIRNMCHDYPCTQPEIEADEEWYRFILRRPASVKGSVETSEKTSEKASEKTSEKILREMKINSQVTIAELADLTDVTPRSVERNIKALQQDGKLRRIGPAKGGHWEVLQ